MSSRDIVIKVKPSGEQRIKLRHVPVIMNELKLCVLLQSGEATTHKLLRLYVPVFHE